MPSVRTKVELSQQVVHFVAKQAPEPRRTLRAALRGLEREAGDIRSLEGPLQNYHRLRVGGYRVIFAYRITKKWRTLHCIFAERRSAVYELFEQLLRQHIIGDEERKLKGTNT
jgi:mRNA-degrading endonuclease RelE of RelBE toxin-antitoxin system